MLKNTYTTKVNELILFHFANPIVKPGIAIFLWA